jgi:purine-binding chemotaxis protein CheW
MLLFRVGTTQYAANLGDAHEILQLRGLTRVPGAPAYVRGLINVRGTIVTVLDLGVRLDPSRAPIADGSILLVRHAQRFAGIVVEEVADVRAFAFDDVDPAASPREIVRGVGQLDGTPVIVLDLHALVKQVLLSWEV